MVRNSQTKYICFKPILQDEKKMYLSVVYPHLQIVLYSRVCCPYLCDMKYSSYLQIIVCLLSVVHIHVS